MTPQRPAAVLSVTASAVLVLMGCTATSPNRSGTTAAPITLRSVYGNGPGSVGGDALAAMIRDGGNAVRITDLWASLHPGEETDSDGEAIADLQEGEADLAVVRAGRLAQAGAVSLSVLQAPGVVTNDDQAMRVAESAAADRTMADLPDIGLVGLAIVPGGVRHPFGYGEALRSPEDFEGAVINARPDAQVGSILAALKAEQDSSVGDARTAAAADGRLRGIEASLGQQGAVDRPAVLTSNVTLYSKFDVLVLRKAVWDGLSAGQRDTLRSLAESARTAAVTARPSESESLAAWCAQPDSDAVLASPEQVGAFAAALAPVASDIRAAVGASLVDEIRALHDGTSDPEGSTCEPSGSGDGAPTLDLEPVGDQGVLDGTWRFERTPEQLVDAGADAQFASDNAGVHTFVVADGTSTIALNQNGADLAPCRGRFVFDRARVLLDWSVDGNTVCWGLDAGTFRLQGDTVTFEWALDDRGQLANQQALMPSMTRIE